MKRLTLVVFLALTLPSFAQTAPTPAELYEGHLACDKVAFFPGAGPLSQRKKTWPADHIDKCQTIEAAYAKYLAEVNKAADMDRAGNLANRLKAISH